MKTIAWAVLAALLAGAIGFYVGASYENARVSGTSGEQGAGQTTGGDTGASPDGSDQPAASVATGTVVARDAQSITIQTGGRVVVGPGSLQPTTTPQDTGGTRTFVLSANTRYVRQEQLTVDDLAVGDRVLAIGTPESGGAAALSIIVVPIGSEFPSVDPESRGPSSIPW